MNLHRTLFCFIALFGLCPSAQAVTSFCVKTSQDLQLDLSLAAKNGDDNVIKIVRSAAPYSLTTVSYYQAYGALSVLGGYDANCNTRIIDPANTIVDFGGTSVLFQTFYAPSDSLLQFDGLTLQNGADIAFAAGSYNCCTPDEAGNLRVTNTRFSHFSAAFNYAGDTSGTLRFVGTSSHMLLSNVLIDHVLQTGVSPCAVSIDVQGNSTSQLSQISADLVSGRAFCFESDDGSDREGGTFQFDVYNSIFWASDGSNPVLRGIETFGTLKVDLANDIFHSYVGDGAVTYASPLAPAQADPLWVDPANGNYHLAPGVTNAAVNTGASIVPFGVTSRDIEGSPRPVGSHPDRGAYESPYVDSDLFTVTNTSDCATFGCGSLRRAIIDADNSTAASTSIRFSIPQPGNPNAGLCPAVIAVDSQLPDITKSMLINGYTQSGSEPNTDALAFDATLCVIVQPNNASPYFGLRVPANASNDVALYLAGIGVGAFPVGVGLFGGSNHQIVGNQFGGLIDNGTYQLYGATTAAVYADVNKFTIGGGDAASRNVFLNTTSYGAQLPASAIQIGPQVNAGAGDCDVARNTIGVQDDGTFAGKNTDYGIYVQGNGCALHDNRIVGMMFDAVNLDGSQGGGSGNLLRNNVLGVVPYGIDFSTTNGGAGIRISGAKNVIGQGPVAGNGVDSAANTIQNMDGGGIVVVGNDSYGNTIRGNSIYNNAGMSIDLGGTGPTVNDISDSDAGPNDLQNFPVAHGIVWSGTPQSGGTATLSGLLRTFPGTYQIDAYYAQGCDAAGRGIARKWIGSLDNVLLPAQVYSVPFGVPVVVPEYLPATGALSVTATNTTNAEGSTSEFSVCVPVDTIFRAGLED